MLRTIIPWMRISLLCFYPRCTFHTFRYFELHPVVHWRVEPFMTIVTCINCETDYSYSHGVWKKLVTHDDYSKAIYNIY